MFDAFLQNNSSRQLGVESSAVEALCFFIVLLTFIAQKSFDRQLIRHGAKSPQEVTEIEKFSHTEVVLRGGISKRRLESKETAFTRSKIHVYMQ